MALKNHSWSLVAADVKTKRPCLAVMAEGWEYLCSMKISGRPNVISRISMDTYLYYTVMTELL